MDVDFARGAEQLVRKPNLKVPTIPDVAFVQTLY